MINTVKNYVPTIPHINFRLSAPKEMAHKATLVALPILALVTIDQLQGAEANEACTRCMRECLAATWGGFKAMCLLICAPICIGGR